MPSSDGPTTLWFYNIESLKWWKFSTFCYLCRRNDGPTTLWFYNIESLKWWKFSTFCYLCFKIVNYGIPYRK